MEKIRLVKTKIIVVFILIVYLILVIKYIISIYGRIKNIKAFATGLESILLFVLPAYLFVHITVINIHFCDSIFI